MKKMILKDSADLEKAKAKLVAELLTPEEVLQVSGAGKDDQISLPPTQPYEGGPHWREFTKFVMAPE